jgi:hypothetical protein
MQRQIGEQTLQLGSDDADGFAVRTAYFQRAEQPY